MGQEPPRGIYPFGGAAGFLDRVARYFGLSGGAAQELAREGQAGGQPQERGLPPAFFFVEAPAGCLFADFRPSAPHVLALGANKGHTVQV